MWDFGGYEPYFMTFDHFIGDPNCIHLVAFSLTEPESIQLAQVTFWLDYLKSRIPPFEPVCKYNVIFLFITCMILVKYLVPT